MPRRVNLPAADDLFRPTDGGSAERPVRAVPDPAPAAPAPEAPMATRPSGRVKHEEKVTVYLTSQELLDIEQARLNLRAGHGLAVDRGRFLREAISLALAEFDEHGSDSALVQRLRRA